MSNYVKIAGSDPVYHNSVRWEPGEVYKVTDAEYAEMVGKLTGCAANAPVADTATGNVAMWKRMQGIRGTFVPPAGWPQLAQGMGQRYRCERPGVYT